MKRLLPILLCVGVLLCCTACFRSPEDETPTVTTTTTTASTTTTTTTAPSSSTDSSASATDSTTSGSGTTTTTAADTPASVVGFTSYPATGWATDSLYVRDAPSTSGKYIGGLAKGSDITVNGKEGDWYRISYNSAEIGWTDNAYVNAAYLTSVEPTA